MKVGDLVKWSGWLYPILIVKTEMVIEGMGSCGKLEPYHRCLVTHKSGTDFIWLFESQLELINGI
jgi:hypothetical protein